MNVSREEAEKELMVDFRFTKFIFGKSKHDEKIVMDELHVRFVNNTKTNDTMGNYSESIKKAVQEISIKYDL